MLRLIIFDWDDVITLGSKEGYYQCYRKTLKEFGIVLPEDELHRRIQKKWGQPFREELKELLLEHPGFLDKAVEIFRQKKFWSNTFVNCLYGVKGANETLIKLSKKYKLAVATGNQLQMLQEKIIPKFKVPNVFAQIITSHDIPPEKTKPDPYMLEIIMNKQNVNPNECVYVGDAENDVQMARNAGVEPIVVLTGHLNKEKARELRVSKIIPDITYLEKIL